MSSPDFTQWFRASAPYIQAFRNKTFVLALPGQTLASDQLKNLVNDISLLTILGIKVVLCFGARPQISEALAKEGITSEYHNHVRVTSKEAMTAVEKEVGQLRSHLESLFYTGLANTPEHHREIHVCSGNYVCAKPLGVLYGVDFQHTGVVRNIKHQIINQLLQQQQIVLLPPIGFSATGELFNLSVFDVAASAAIALRADKLIMYSKQGALRDQDGQIISALSQEEAAQYWSSSPEALPQSAIHALNGGVPRVQLVSYEHDGAILQELFTRDGEGTLIYRDHYELLRPATLDDVSGILALIEPLENQQILVERSRELLENEIHRFWVADRDGMAVACMALYPQDDGSSAEIACVATHPDYQNQGLAARLLAALEKQAREQHLQQLFVLTTRTEHWFIEQGFRTSSVEQLPASRQSFYNLQRNSKVFVKTL